MDFTEEPDYEFLKGLLEEIYSSNCYENKEEFDWNI